MFRRLVHQQHVESYQQQSAAPVRAEKQQSAAPVRAEKQQSAAPVRAEKQPTPEPIFNFLQVIQVNIILVSSFSKSHKELLLFVIP
jgi:hypothetical protein